MKEVIKQIAATIIGSAIMTGLSANVIASSVTLTPGTPVTVTDVTDWGTTPMEIVNLDLPYAGYNGGVYAGINTLSVSQGGNTIVASGFCIDPFHFSLGGTINYTTIALGSAPKYPGPMGATTALEISELWTEYFPAAQSSATVAAGLQIAIWDLVAESAALANGVPESTYYTLTSGNDYGAAADIASLADFSGPVDNLIGLTGPGQDYVIAVPVPPPQPNVPDSGTTFALLGATLAGIEGLRRKLA